MITDTAFSGIHTIISRETIRKRRITDVWLRWFGAYTKPSCILRQTSNKTQEVPTPGSLRQPARP